MDRNDRDAIENLFGKLADVERRGAPRDEEAEYFMAEMIRRQPGAPYYMAQTVLVQEQALEAAQRRIEELESSASQRTGGGGLLDSVFGGSRTQAPARGSVPRVGRQSETPRASPWGAGAGRGSALGGTGGFGGGYGRGGGGFLAGAAQTAMGVAGGVLLGNALAGMFDGGEAQAAEGGEAGDAAGADSGADAGAQDAGFDSGGDAGFGDFGGGDEF